jgi:16S rRNA (uracil1498-N3)-methyltransferase
MKIQKRSIECSYKESIEKNTELWIDISLFQALPNKVDKLEEIVQKWAEVWLKNITFFKAERSQKVHITEKKYARIQKICEEAVEQTGRNYMPKILFIDQEYFLSKKKNTLQIFLHTQSDNSISASECVKLCQKNTYSEIEIYVWPEWWFSGTEIEEFTWKWCKRVHLWPRIMRTQTAGIVMWFLLWQMV